MKPKEKAIELGEQFKFTKLIEKSGEYFSDDKYTERIIVNLKWKESAMICVNEIIKSRPIFPMNYDEKGIPVNQIEWWQQVEEEIKKL